MPFEVPAGPELAARLASVLEVIYLVFNEGYAATAGDDWMRPDALLRRTPARSRPRRAHARGAGGARARRADGDPGLAARARIGPTGEPVLLLDQDRSRWDAVLVRRGLAALARAEQVDGARGPYWLQAAIAACHARARTPEETDWVGIAALYDALSQLAPSPVVDLNRAVALGMAFGPEVGLELVDRLVADGSLHELPPPAERPRRPPREARTLRRGHRRVRRRGGAHPERTRARPPPGARHRVRRQGGGGGTGSVTTFCRAAFATSRRGKTPWQRIGNRSTPAPRLCSAPSSRAPSTASSRSMPVPRSPRSTPAPLASSATPPTRCSVAT